jgi:hypothetical protein
VNPGCLTSSIPLPSPSCNIWSFIRCNTHNIQDTQTLQCRQF